MAMDVLVWIILLNFISIIFFSAVWYFYTNLNIIRDDFYNEILLTECAEAVQWFRYWEWDRNNESWWDNFRNTYPTWMYYLNFDNINNTWTTNRIMTPWMWSFHVQDMPTIKLNNLDRIWPGWQVEVIPVDTNSDKNNAFRLFFIDTSSANQVTVKCYVKYDFNTKWKSSAIWDDYKEVKFIMMNYL